MYEVIDTGKAILKIFLLKVIVVIAFLLYFMESLLYNINNKVKEQISEITSARIKQIIIDSIFLLTYKFNNIIVIIILITNSNTCDIALLYPFLTAEK